MDLRGVSISELQRRYGARNGIPGPSVVEALRRDPRAGAQALAVRLERIREERLAESRRLRALSLLEDRLRRAGAARVAGVDEVGMGPLAGPVVAAAVVLPSGVRVLDLDDSKRLRPEVRERVEREIRRVAAGVALGWASPEEIDRLNIYRAGLLAMRRAVLALSEAPDSVVVDGRTIPDLDVPQQAVPGGDRSIAAVAAASVVAKVYRDAWMCDLGRRYPAYGFERNAGYGTPEHLDALSETGPCPVHRLSYAPVRAAGPIRTGV
jgi:ribonuclease HII